MDWHTAHVIIESAALVYIILTHHQHKKEKDDLKNIIISVAEGTAKITLGPDKTIRITNINRR